jgi:hypothetical protein
MKNTTHENHFTIWHSCYRYTVIFKILIMYLHVQVCTAMLGHTQTMYCRWARVLNSILCNNVNREQARVKQWHTSNTSKTNSYTSYVAILQFISNFCWKEAVIKLDTTIHCISNNYKYKCIWIYTNTIMMENMLFKFHIVISVFLFCFFLNRSRKLEHPHLMQIYYFYQDFIPWSFVQCN